MRRDERSIRIDVKTYVVNLSFQEVDLHVAANNLVHPRDDLKFFLRALSALHFPLFVLKSEIDALTIARYVDVVDGIAIEIGRHLAALDLVEIQERVRGSDE